MVETRQRPKAEIGTTGLRRWGGRVAEEFLPELQGPRGVRAYDELRKSDPVIGSVLRATRDTILSLQWTADPADDSPEAATEAEFVEQCMDDMSHPWSDFLSEILTMLPFGWSYFNQVYKVRSGEDADPPSSYSDGRIGWRKFSLRKQDSLEEWAFDDNGGIQGMWQRAAPTYQRIMVPIEESVLFRVEHEANNPEGTSFLRVCYRPGQYKRNLEEIEAIGIERDFTGLMWIELPNGASDADHSTALDILERVKVDDQAGIVTTKGMDADGREDWKVNLLTAPGSKQIDIDKAITRYAGEIATAFLAQFLRLGQSAGGRGSYALSRDHKDFFYLAIGAIADSIEQTINRYAVAKLMRMNGVKRELWPQIKHGRIAQREMASFMAAIKVLSDVGALGPVDGPLVNFFRRELEMPEIDEEEYDAQDGEGVDAENDTATGLDQNGQPPPPQVVAGLEPEDVHVPGLVTPKRTRRARWYTLAESDLRGWVTS